MTTAFRCRLEKSRRTSGAGGRRALAAGRSLLFVISLVAVATGRSLLFLISLATLLPVQAEGFAPWAPLPRDSSVVKGELDNGLTYIVRENARPAARASLRLVVKAGSVDEDDDQRGLAHFVEHMLFNGTESYAGNEIVAYLESIGARFGADLNASTSFDETIYMLEIPTDREGLLPEGIKVLAEFAAKASLTSEEIEKERGVVLDEWRRGLGAGKRVRDQQLPILLKGSRYAERLPIGLPEVIEGADPEVLRRFYRDWYRPERMAIVCVGEFESEEVVQWIRDSFGAIPPTKELRERIDWDVPALSDTLFALADDPELTGTSVGWSVKHKAPEDEATYGGYARDLVERMSLAIFNQRLDERARAEARPFLGAGLGTHSIGRKVELTEASARVVDGGEAQGLAALVEEVRRAEEHGFLDSEVERARTNMLAQIQATYAERDKLQSSSFAAEYTRHFLDDEPIPGIELEHRLWNEVLPGFTAEDCHEAFLALFDGGGMVVEASRPSREDLAGEEDLEAALRQASKIELEPYVDAAVFTELVKNWRPAGHVKTRRTIPEIGTEELVLSNDVRVFLKPTDFQDDDIRFLGSSFGGTSLAPDEELASAEAAGSIVGESGFGGHTIIELRKLLAGKVASASPYFQEREHGVSGSSTVADLETALSLVVLMMTEPNTDPAAFERFRERLRTDLANREADPAARYHDRVVAINTRDHPRERPMTLARMEEIDHAKALEFYRSAFANAADFTFFFVGNLDLESVIPLLERTLGSLPSRGKRAAQWIDRKVELPRETIHEKVAAGREPKGLTTIMFPSYGGSDPDEWHRLRTAASILERRLRETLREDLGATYGVGVDFRHAMIGPARGRVAIRFGSDPNASEALAEEVFQAIARLREEGAQPEELEKEKEIQSRDLETLLEENNFWAGALQSLWMRKRSLLEVLDRQARIDALDLKDLHRVFRKHFEADPHTWVWWVPETTGAAGS